MIDLDTIVERNESIITAGLDGKAMMMSIESGRYYGFNEIATDVWESLGAPITVGDLIARLKQEYEVSYKRCEKSITEFLSRLYNENLIKIN